MMDSRFYGSGNEGRALREARDIYVVQILKVEGILWLRRVGFDGEPGVAGGVAVFSFEAGMPGADSATQAA